jgi:hypothetical protein
MHRFLLPACLVLFLATVQTRAADPLESGFKNPPQSAHPQTWWHWMNGNITKEGIQADLTAMKQIGLDGATIVNADSGIPAGKVPFMSPEWRDDFKFAVQTASKLGLQLGVENCAGWSSSGGPWITPEYAMQHVTTSEVTVTGSAEISIVVPKPPEKLNYYRDIALLAFPLPAGEDARMVDAQPTVTLSTGQQNGGSLVTGTVAKAAPVALPKPGPGKPQFVQLSFPQPFTARTVLVTGTAAFPGGKGHIATSDDGVTFKQIQAIDIPHGGPNPLSVSLGSNAVTSRYWRIQFDSILPRESGTGIALTAIDLSPTATVSDFQYKDGDAVKLLISSTGASTSTEGAVPLNGVIDLAGKMDAADKLTWSAPPGRWVILRIGYTPTGITNHPAPAAGTGLECDKFTTAALDQHWAGFMQKVLADIGPLAGKTLTSSLIDSYEVRGQNWSTGFAAEFKKRRGYDPTKYLPAFTGRVVDSPAVTERFLWDVRRTIADLFAENYYGYFSQLCQQHGLQSAIEPYTGPFESIQSGVSAGIVMGEFWSGSQGEPSIKLASSIAHIDGKQIVGAESFTARPPANGRWQEDPYSLKALGDLMYTQGLNRFIFHRYAMQPWLDRYPGMTMGQWGFHFERTITWWQQGKAWIDYLARCQYLLQQGRAIQDAAYFDGESAPVETRPLSPGLPPGFDYDFVDTAAILHATVKNGRLTLPSGANYAALVLPPADINMTPGTLNAIRNLVQAGATIVGPPPQSSPSLSDYPNCDQQVKDIVGQLWGSDQKTTPDHQFGKGRVVWAESLDQIFSEQNLEPDFEFTNASGHANLAYTHRLIGNDDVYFVSNQQRQFDSEDCTFRIDGKTPELWHPDTGTVEAAPVWSVHDGRTTVHVDFDPAGSVFVVFRPGAQPDHILSTNATFASLIKTSGTSTISGTSSTPTISQPPQWKLTYSAKPTPQLTAWANGSVELRTANGKVLHAAVTNIPATVEVSGTWNLTFPPNWGAPPSIALDHLISWPDSNVDGVRYFSGTATYTKQIAIPKALLGANHQLWLNLGEVKNFAEVTFNGHDLGVLWKPPFNVNITNAAKPGENQLIVKVTNLWPNRLIGDEQLPPDVQWQGQQLKAWPQWLLDGKPSPTGRLTFTTWHHWTKGMPLLPSGLIGPVTLAPAEVIAAK